MLIVERTLSALPSDRLIKSDDTVELFDLVDADTSHSFERCHINVAVGCDDILQDRQLHSHLEEQPTLAVTDCRQKGCPHFEGMKFGRSLFGTAFTYEKISLCFVFSMCHEARCALVLGLKKIYQKKGKNK